MISIRKSLSTKLSLSILLLAVPIFIISLGTLYTQARHMIRQEAVGRANSVLSAAMQRIVGNLITIETATNANSWLVTQNLQPESLLGITNYIVRFNPHIDGCSISTEPNVFPKYGRYFSAYSVRVTADKRKTIGTEADSVSTVIEEQYEYFDKVWYKMPRELENSCWVVYYDEADSLTLTLDGLIASYSKPLYDDNGRFVAVISTDLSLLRLSKIVSTEEKPYSNSYFMMVDEEGRYYIHPDSTRLFTHTIFSGADPRQHSDVIALGHEMTKGRQGSMVAAVDGVTCLVSYQPVPGTKWSLALVCPDSDILQGYHTQTYIIAVLLIIGLLVILLISYRAVSHTIRPINQLLSKTQSIAAGNMEVHIPRSKREDAVGRLQNSFATMLESLNFHMGSVRYTTEQTQQRNEELIQATQLAMEAERQKTAFIQSVSHQIRTPLNIIMGFAQILRDTSPAAAVPSSGIHHPSPNIQESLSEEEMTSIINMMDYNAKLLYRLVMMLYDSSETGLSEEIQAMAKFDSVACNDVVREAISYIMLRYPNISIRFQSEVPDDLCVETNHLYLMRSLRELLYNAAKYSDGQHVSVLVSVHNATQQGSSDTAPSPGSTVRFIVEDTGKGIAEAERERMFMFFAKIDDLSEGLGLGLPLSKRHARNLGGDLTLDENYHDGCRFILEIPLKQG